MLVAVQCPCARNACGEEETNAHKIWLTAFCPLHTSNARMRSHCAQQTRRFPTKNKHTHTHTHTHNHVPPSITQGGGGAQSVAPRGRNRAGPRASRGGRPWGASPPGPSSPAPGWPCG